MLLHLEQCNDITQLHQYLKEQLHFPDYYGCNLDALHDCLEELPLSLTITFTGTEVFLERFGEYGRTMLTIFERRKS